MAIVDSPIKVVDAQEAVSMRHTHPNKTTLDKWGENGDGPLFDGQPVTGAPGPAGPAGPAGEPGIQGPPGEKGLSFSLESTEPDHDEIGLWFPLI